MMKQIQEKYSKTQLNYINLENLKFKVIRRKDDNFYKIVDNTKIRRNYSFSSEQIIKQSTLFDLGEMFLLSKIHIKESNLMKIKLEISPNLNGPWVSVENDINLISGKIRVLKVGSLPCRYFRLTVIKGCPIMDYTKIECFGLNINNIKNKYDEDTLDMLYYNAYDLIYRKNNSSENLNYNNNLLKSKNSLLEKYSKSYDSGYLEKNSTIEKNMEINKESSVKEEENEYINEDEN